jgi:hypothetical protein
MLAAVTCARSEAWPLMPIHAASFKAFSRPPAVVDDRLLLGKR